MRTVLLLINGFGIEKKESYSAYDSTVMPTFDKLTKNYLFTQITSNVRNVYDGFRNMSLNTRELYNYSIFENKLYNTQINVNPVYKEMEKNLQLRKCKLHLFCFVDNSVKIVDNLKMFLKTINKDNDKHIYLHLFLTSSTFEDYPAILEIMSKINIELSEYAKVGMVVGFQNVLNDIPEIEMNFLLKTMISELGEQWSSYTQKIEVCYGLKQAPNTIKAFIVNKGFSIEKDDLFLVWNYDNVDISRLIGGIKSFDYGEKNPNQILFYSVFPVKYKEPIPSMLNFEVASNSLATNMKGLGFKTLILTDKDTVNGINYYLNGLVSVNNPNISYMAINSDSYDSESIIKLLDTTEQEFVIINLNISNLKEQTIDCFREKLKEVDKLIEGLYNNFMNNKYNIVISSLFGLNRRLTDKTGEICNIMYLKVPIIYIDSLVTKKNYIVDTEGDISDLFNVCYKSINRKYYGESIITKKNLLYRIVFK